MQQGSGEREGEDDILDNRIFQSICVRFIMASSNRQWTSMFKSKPCDAHHHHRHQWQHMFSSCHKQPYSSSVGCEERTPEPKPRWNPRPEQIRILEAIFNSGVVNPPREEIKKIRAQLQEYGQVGDANVFYWFQNRKSRSKHKRHLASKSQLPTSANPSVITTVTTNYDTNTATTNSSSSSSSEKTSAATFASLIDHTIPAVNSPFHSADAPTNYQAGVYPLPRMNHEFPVQDSILNLIINQTTPFTSPDLSEVSSLVQVNELLKNVEQQRNLDGNQNQNCTTDPTWQDFGDPVTGLTTLTVFINDLAFEVTPTPLNVKESFGENAVLLHSSGDPVMMDEFGVTLQPLQNGGFYYLV